MQKQRLFSTLVLLGITLTVLVALYHPVLRHPNSTMMGSSADAIKNYYTPWYHAKWDSSYTWFQGMNYPYGDHVVFADAQPLLSNAIKILGLADHTVGIMNYAMLLSIVLAGWLQYRILLRWQVDAYWAAMAGAAIALLSPQILRFNAHYGLAYAFVVPLIWHLALRAFELPSLRRSLSVAITVFLLGWLHPYYVMISAVFLTAFWGMHSWVAWRSTKVMHKILHYALQVVLPVLLFTLALKLTDPVTDRPGNPFGFDQYIATWKSIFLPIALYGFDALLPAKWILNANSWEGIGYVGLVAGLAFLGYWAYETWRFLGKLWNGKWRQFRLLENEQISPETQILITVSMLAGLAVGLFACGIPFAFKPELMTLLFPPIKQFRSLGRFSWVFYYTWTTFSFYLVWRLIGWLHNRKLEWATWVFGGCVIGFTLFEGAALNRGVQMRVTASNPAMKDTENSEIILGLPIEAWMDSISRGSDWSAMMVLPYFHEGSENFHTPVPQNSRLAFQASIRSGLPMLNVMMSRTSFSQTWSHLQIVTEPSGDLEIMQHLKDRRPILMLRTSNSDTLDGRGLAIPALNRLIANDPRLYALNLLQPLERDVTMIFDTIYEVMVEDRSRLAPPAKLCTNLQGSNLIWRDFEVEGSGARASNIDGYHEGLAIEIPLKDNNFLHDGPMPFAAGDTVIVSLWVKMRGDQLPLTELGWEEWKGDEKINWHYLSLNNSIQRIDGDWALCEREEVIRDPAHKFQVNVTRWKRIPPFLTIDKLMIRKKGTDVYGFENGQLVWLNNRYMPHEITWPTGGVHIAPIDARH
jgi:hypothetical protein